MNVMDVAHEVPSRLGAPSDVVVEVLESILELVEGASGPIDETFSAEVADQLTPVWNDQVWQLFVDLALYEVDEAETGGPPEMSATEWARGLVRWALQTTVENILTTREV